MTGPLLGLAAGLAVATLCALLLRRASRRSGQAGQGWWAVLPVSVAAGLVGARLGYGFLHLEYYASAPLELLKLWKDSFVPAAGAVAALTAAVLLGRRYRLGAAPALPVLAGLLVWGAVQEVHRNLAPAPRIGLPPLAIETMAGEPARLTDFQGRPLVVNLWASWCPPCRQEMPALETSQQRHPGVDFLFLNQGEDVATIALYLKDEDLALSHVLRDPGSSASKRLRAAAIPTTLFFDAEGRLVDAYTGELTPPRLEDHLRRLRRHVQASR